MDSITNSSIYYNTRPLQAYAQVKITKTSMEQILKERPFIYSRSTYAGQGRIGSHWLGDNVSTFRSMYLSISGMLAMNMFGLTHVGADIPGFSIFIF
jgi:alpha-glucosidase (family GH31 glycosyl hydrolase)